MVKPAELYGCRKCIILTCPKEKTTNNECLACTMAFLEMYLEQGKLASAGMHLVVLSNILTEMDVLTEEKLRAVDFAGKIENPLVS